MKKSLLALAALSAFATAAQAQSTVSVYGIVDMSWQSVDNDAGQTFGALGNNALASSRLGFKGTEDLGGGLKANFVLESALDVVNGRAGTTNAVTGVTSTTTGTGTAAASNIFNRAAWVGLSSATFGELRVGKQDVTAANDIDVMSSQMGNLGNWSNSLDDSTVIGDNADNAVVYISPSFNGFQVQAGYASKNTATVETTTGDVTAYMISYTQGPLKLFAAQQEEKAIASSANKEETLLGASYDAGFASFGVAISDGDNATIKRKQSSYTVAVPVKALGSGVKVHAGYLVNEDKDTANADITTTRLAVTKALSKRTTVYAAYSSADHDAGIVAPSAPAANAGKTVTTTAVGVLHTF
jgi:predicted porin